MIACEQERERQRQRENHRERGTLESERDRSKRVRARKQESKRAREREREQERERADTREQCVPVVRRRLVGRARADRRAALRNAPFEPQTRRQQRQTQTL